MNQLIRFATLGAIVAMGIGVMLAQHWYSSGGYMTDDAFISFRYARNMADGLGPVWESGNRVEGYTNFGWILLMAGALKFGVDPVDSSRAFGLLASAATLALLPLLAAQLRPAWSGSWWLLAAGAVLATAVSPGTALWATAGLETPGVMLVAVAVATAHLYEERSRRLPVISPLILVAGTLIRPDVIVLAAVTGVFKCVRLLDAGGRWNSEARVSALRDVVLWGLLFAVPFLAYWMWRWWYYTDFFPNTYYLKSDHSRAMWDRGWEYTSDFIRLQSVWLTLLAVVSIVRERSTRHRPALYLLATVAVWLLYVTDSGGDWMPYFRFLMPILPLVFVLMLHGAIDLVDVIVRAVTKRSGGHTASMVAGAAATAAIVVLAMLPTNNADAENPAGFEVNSHILPGSVDENWQRAIGEWLHENVPPDYTVAQIATGIVPYYSQLPTVDMLGVNDRHIAHRDIPLGYGAAGHEKEDGGYVISLKPEIIWLGLSLEQVPLATVQDYQPPRYTEWVPVKTNITQNAYIWLLYRPVAIRMGDAWLNLLVRADVEHPSLVSDPSVQQ